MTDRAPASRGRIAWPATSSVLTGLLGWVALVLVARHEGPTAYAGFAVLWAAFFGIGGAYAGLQQEVMRSTTRAAASPQIGSGRLVPAALLVGAPLVLLVLLLPHLLPTGDAPGVGASTALVLGLLGLCVLTALGGVLAARGAWGTLAGLLVLDATLRLVGITLALTVGDGGPTALAWGIGAATFAWLPLSALPSVRAAWRSRGVDRFAGLAARGGAAMLASGSAALIVTGLPLLVAVAGRDGLDARAGALLASLVLVRSPVLQVVYAYRPVLLAVFLRREDVGLVWRWWATCLAGGAVLVVGAAALGPTVVALVLGDGFSTSRADLAVLAASAVALTLLVLSGLALVAADRHAAATAGWLAAVGATLVALLVAPSVTTGLLVSSVAGPAAGVLAHAVALLRVARAQSRPSENADSRSWRE